jgi:thiamine-phosphate pyrophosphorylase
MEIPGAASGGITGHTPRGRAAAGADFLAVSAGVWSYGEGPAAAVAALNAEIEKGLADRG